MSYRAAAAAIYQREVCPRSFLADLAAHRRYGHVFDEPEFFCMGRAVRRDAAEALILDPSHVFSEPDAWLVWLVAGDMAKAWASFPCPLTWVGFQRGNRLRWLPFAALERKLCLAK